MSNEDFTQEIRKMMTKDGMCCTKTITGMVFPQKTQERLNLRSSFKLKAKIFSYPVLFILEIRW